MKDNAILPAPKRGVAKIAAREARQHVLPALPTLISLPTALDEERKYFESAKK